MFLFVCLFISRQWEAGHYQVPAPFLSPLSLSTASLRPHPPPNLHDPLHPTHSRPLWFDRATFSRAPLAEREGKKDGSRFSDWQVLGRVTLCPRRKPESQNKEKTSDQSDLWASSLKGFRIVLHAGLFPVCLCDSAEWISPKTSCAFNKSLLIFVLTLLVNTFVHQNVCVCVFVRARGSLLLIVNEDWCLQVVTLHKVS